MIELKDIAIPLREAEWQWSTAWWDNKAAELRLTLRESKGSRRTYSDRAGLLWDTYFEGARLLQVEVEIEAFVEVSELSDSAYEDKIDEYTDKFEEMARYLEGVFGKPLFKDGAAAEGFPDDQDATRLALWAGRNARLMLQQKNEDRDMPFRLLLVVAPR